MPDTNLLNQTTFLILAGGRGQRMNGTDKGLMQWQGQPMIEHVIKHLGVAPKKIIISANRNLETYQQYAQQVISDAPEIFTKNQQERYSGPLAGILTAMHTCTTAYLLCVPCDSPRPPENLLSGLSQCLQQQNKKAAICHDGERLQPLFSLLSCEYESLLLEFLQQGRRKVQDFMHLLEPAICDFSAQKERFNNFNQPDDMS